MFDFNDNYIEELNNAYWIEEEEMKAGVHPTQVKERIERCLVESEVQYKEITYLDWNVTGTRVKVSLDNVVYGVFDYTENVFVDVA